MNKTDVESNPEFHYTEGHKVAFLTVDVNTSRRIFEDASVEPKKISKNKQDYEYVPWGSTDDAPNQAITKAYKNPATSTGLEFNITLGYGDGVMPVRKELDGDKLKLVPVLDNTEINEFLEHNDINLYLLEQMTDVKHFFNVFPEIILNREDTASKRRVVELNHKEAAFSRWTKMNDKGRIEYHLYCSKFGTSEDIKPEDLDVTPALDFKRPILDLKRRMGLAPDLNGKARDEKKFRYIVPVTFPTPGKFYYQKPYWWSIFESGWYDYAAAIPEFKNALLKNQMTIKYVVYIVEEYWTELFAAEGIKTPEAKQKRKKEEYDNIQDFLSGAKNTGKAVTSKMKYFQDKENKYIKIEPVENAFQGGEYIEDSEEASNIISYSLGVHPSLIGSSPGKSKTINGTEARELFTIKQALMKPVRDRLLRPLYLVKAINKWPEDIHFAIPNLQLTTLDKNTGAEKTISQPAL